MTGIAETLRIVIAGHVDHGKSTLIGRLLLDTGSLPDGKREQLAAIAARRGVPLELANITDALQAERDQNVTIETSQIWFRSNRREYVLIDAPGHKEFVKNMVTGAAGADAALVVVDAQEGVREQSRRHGRLLKLLGIHEILIVINKMDLVGYSQAEFERAVTDYRGFLSHLGLTPDVAVPISARCGDNIAVRSERMPWYRGPTIVEALDGIAGPPSSVDAPLRLAVQDVYRFDHRRILAGRVESGTLRVGDELLFLPSGKTSRVNTIERWNAPATGLAVSGDSIGVTLSDPLFLERGQIGAPAQNAPVLAREFGAQLFWLGRRPLRKGRLYTIKLATQELDAEIVEVANVIDAATLADTGLGVAEDVIDRNQVGRVTIRAVQPVVLDPYEQVPHLGRFVVVDELGVSGGGVVIGPRERSAPLAVSVASRNLTRSFRQVAQEERQTRNGHKGAVVWFTGLSGAGKSTLATALEHALFTRGWQPFVLDGDNVRLGLNADLGFSAQDRAENIRRVAEVAKLFAEAGMIAITAFISPYRSDRARARQIMQREGLSIPFVEVYVSTPLAVCESRDPKGLYQRARDGKIESFTGISAPFEPPERAEVTIDTSATAVSEAVNRVLERLTPLVEL